MFCANDRDIHLPNKFQIAQYFTDREYTTSRIEIEMVLKSLLLLPEHDTDILIIDRPMPDSLLYTPTILRILVTQRYLEDDGTALHEVDETKVVIYLYRHQLNDKHIMIAGTANIKHIFESKTRLLRTMPTRSCSS